MSSTEQDDGFVLDLTDYRPRRRRRLEMEPPADSWTANASPLEHYSMATWQCHNPADPETERTCREAAWADHLRACWFCDRAERFEPIRKFAKALREERAAAS